MASKYTKRINLKLAELRLFLEFNTMYWATIAVILGLFTLLYLIDMPQSNRIKQQNELKGIALGRIDNISSKSGFVQDLDGASEVTITNIVTYTFMVDGKYYSDVNNIKHRNRIEYNEKG